MTDLTTRPKIVCTVISKLWKFLGLIYNNVFSMFFLESAECTVIKVAWPFSSEGNYNLSLEKLRKSSHRLTSLLCFGGIITAYWLVIKAMIFYVVMVFHVDGRALYDRNCSILSTNGGLLVIVTCKLHKCQSHLLNLIDRSWEVIL